MVAVERAEDEKQLNRMRLVSLLEGSTLLLLVFVAVPLKHLASIPLATTIMGPIHGVAFVLYVWTVIQTVSGGGWSRSDTIKLIVAAVIPGGAFVSERTLARRQATPAASA